MPDQDQSIPIAPPIAPNEEAARSILRNALTLFKSLRIFLQAAHLQLPDPPDAEAMGEGTIPESLTYALRGSIEIVLADHVEPGILTVRRALRETPARLAREWARKHPKGGEN